MAARIALVREVSATFAQALSADPPDPPIDVALARDQHARYRAAIADVLGLSVIAVPSDDTLPDACFVEDTAVVAAGVALITRPGAPSRRGETAAVATTLGSLGLELAHVAEPATLDGGDCMLVGTTLFVGTSERTNTAGIARLVEVFGPRGIRVLPLALPAGVLHLKCVCAPLGHDRITLADGTIPAAAFGSIAIVPVPAGESYAANVLASGASVLVADGFPHTRDALHAAGFRVTALPTTEVRKADGALTCLSIVL